MILELDDVVVVAQMCIILHQLIVQMQQNGDFKDEGGGENLIVWFYERDQGASTEAIIVYESNTKLIRQEARASNYVNIVEEGFFNENTKRPGQ